MANGELCRHCGQQETDHESPDEKICPLGFVSEVVHDPTCPILDCNGNCSETIRSAKRTEEQQRAQWDKIQH